MTDNRDKILQILAEKHGRQSIDLANDLGLTEEAVIYIVNQLMIDHPGFIMKGKGYGDSQSNIMPKDSVKIKGFLFQGGYTKIEEEKYKKEQEKRLMELAQMELTALQIDQIKKLPLQDKKARCISIWAVIIAGLALIAQIIQIFK